VSGERILVSTVLGSCVGATLFLPRRQLGGMFHALLPSQEESVRPHEAASSCRFVDGALKHLLAAFVSFGVAPGEIEAKLFGGADMFSERQGGGSQVGRRNVDRAEEVLRAAGLKIVTSDVGGGRGRKILFSPTTGEVWVRRVGGNRQASCPCGSTKG
jgi:chemotaxis protein CheD